jgi:hypothetical protein
MKTDRMMRMMPLNLRVIAKVKMNQRARRIQAKQPRNLTLKQVLVRMRALERNGVIWKKKLRRVGSLLKKHPFNSCALADRAKERGEDEPRKRKGGHSSSIPSKRRR